MDQLLTFHMPQFAYFKKITFVTSNDVFFKTTNLLHTIFIFELNNYTQQEFFTIKFIFKFTNKKIYSIEINSVFV